MNIDDLKKGSCFVLPHTNDRKIVCLVMNTNSKMMWNAAGKPVEEDSVQVICYPTYPDLPYDKASTQNLQELSRIIPLSALQAATEPSEDDIFSLENMILMGMLVWKHDLKLLGVYMRQLLSTVKDDERKVWATEFWSEDKIEETLRVRASCRDRLSRGGVC